ncbi:MAG: hypothetical protein IPJ65_14925 [Archangiaceae bacterium]|nr:hypothetical protein [Archangiaceae bacterium]
MKASVDAVNEWIPAHAQQVGAGVALVGVTSGVLMPLAVHNPPYQPPSFPLTPLTACNDVEAQPHAISGRLADGRTWQVVIDQAAKASPGTVDPLALCQVTANARAEGLATIDWLASPQGQKADGEQIDAARATLELDRVTLAAGNLVSVSIAMADPAGAPQALQQGLDADLARLTAALEKKDPTEISAAYQAVDQRRVAISTLAATLGTADPTRELSVLEGGAEKPDTKAQPYVLGGKDDPLFEKYDGLKTQTVDARVAQLEALVAKAVAAQGSAVSTLVRANAATFAAAHPKGEVPQKYVDLFRNALAGGQSIAAAAKAVEADFRAQPGIADQYLPQFIDQGVTAAYRNELGGGTPSQELLDKAKEAFFAGDTVGDLYAFARHTVRSSLEWRQHVVDSHLGEYYPQPDNWSCSASSAVNVLALLGVASPSYDLRQHFVNLMGVTPGVGLPFGGAPRIGDYLQRVANEHGVQLDVYKSDYVYGLDPIVRALQDGKVVLLSGTLPSGSGHFIVIKKINPDGSLVMADPWPSYSNRTISQGELLPFIQREGSRFVAVSVAP